MLKTVIRVIYESLSPLMLITPKDFFNFISPAPGSICHTFDAQQIFVGWVDGWMTLLASCLLCFPVSASLSNILLIMESWHHIKGQGEARCPGSKSRKPSKRKAAKTGFLGVPQGYSEFFPMSHSCFHSHLYLRWYLRIKSTFCSKIGE